MDDVTWNDTDFRIKLDTTFSDDGRVEKVAGSGYPKGVRAVYISVLPGANSLTPTGLVTIELKGSRYRSVYYRKFQLQARHMVAIDADGMESLEVRVVGNSVPVTSGPIYVTAIPSFNPPDARYRRQVMCYETWASANPTATPVPPGAAKIIPYTAIPGWIWSMYNAAGTEVTLPTALVAGVESPILGTHFTPVGIDIEAVWVIDL